MQPKDALGRAGEDLAARYLNSQGLIILARNWRCRAGEIDLVAQDGDTVVFCEVKTRSTDNFDGPLAAITPRRLRRLEYLAQIYVSSHGLTRYWTRLDGIGIVHTASSGPRITHVQGLH